MKEKDNRDQLLKEIFLRIRNYRGSRGTVFLDGKVVDSFELWLRARILTEDETYIPTLQRIHEGQVIEKGEHILQGRGVYHLARLLSKDRTESERSFAKTMIDLGPSLFYQIDLPIQFSTQRTRLLSCILKENMNVPLWWSVSPYIHEKLINKGTMSDDSLRFILNWTAASGPTVPGDYNVTLPGLELLTGLETFVLRGDSNDWTHQTAGLIADYLLPDIQKFNEPIL